MLHSKARRDCGPSRLLQKALRSASPQPHHSFPQADQVKQPDGASEADPEMGLMAQKARFQSQNHP